MFRARHSKVSETSSRVKAKAPQACGEIHISISGALRHSSWDRIHIAVGAFEYRSGRRNVHVPFCYLVGLEAEQGLPKNISILDPLIDGRS